MSEPGNLYIYVCSEGSVQGILEAALPGIRNQPRFRSGLDWIKGLHRRRRPLRKVSRFSGLTVHRPKFHCGT